MSLALLALPLLQSALDAPYLVTVHPGARVHFRDAPRAGAAMRKAYVLPGDPLVADRTSGGFTSVTFVTAKGQPSTGWIETAALRRVAAARPTPAAWSGAWRFADSSIDIRAGKLRGTLHVEGSATWGAHDPERVERGGVHVGDFLGEVRPAGDRVTYADSAICTVRMRLLGPYLLVEDNGQCGGVNVTFTGTYRR